MGGGDGPVGDCGAGVVDKRDGGDFFESGAQAGDAGGAAGEVKGGAEVEEGAGEIGDTPNHASDNVFEFGAGEVDVVAVAPDGDGDGGFGVDGELFFGVVDGLLDGPHDLGWCRVEFSGEVWVVAFEAADEPLVEQVVNGEPAEAAVAGGCGDAHVAGGFGLECGDVEGAAAEVAYCYLRAGCAVDCCGPGFGDDADGVAVDAACRRRFDERHHLGDGPRFGVGDGDGGGWVAGVLGAAGVEGGSEGGADDGGERHGGTGNGDEFVFDVAFGVGDEPGGVVLPVGVGSVAGDDGAVFGDVCCGGSDQ